MNAVNAAMAFRILAICLYITSLFLSPFKTQEPNYETVGLFILFFGWMEALDGGVFAWFANPLAFFCFFFVRKHPKLCVFLSLLALVLAHDFYEARSLGFDNSVDTYNGTVVGIAVGSYVWLCSLLLTFIASVTQLVVSRHPTEKLNDE